MRQREIERKTKRMRERERVKVERKTKRMREREWPRTSGEVRPSSAGGRRQRTREERRSVVRDSEDGGEMIVLSSCSMKGKNVSMPKGAVIECNDSSSDYEELPKDVVRLMDCEAAGILQGIQDQLVVLSEDSTIKPPRTLKSHKVSDEEVATANMFFILHAPCDYSNPHLSIFSLQICLIANTCPEIADELFALIPSLKENKIRIERAIKDVLSELAKLKSGDLENKCT
ncbi:hypothetical protein Sjap_003955 [Stephania japonica]|uniref:Uncharacterized protein n=1 Tax=Stephania japonica TaxID=461633 RepID=A0AAP0PVH7_9MAGN